MLPPETQRESPEEEELPAFLEHMSPGFELPPILCVARNRFVKLAPQDELPRVGEEASMLRLSRPNETPAPGWVEVLTPLGAVAHAEVNGPSHEICDDWRMLTKGRMSLVDKTNFGLWFGPLFAGAPPGLVAELLLANGMLPQFTAQVAADPGVRAHLARLPEHCVRLDLEERERLAQALDIARLADARDAARLAALEAVSGV